VGKANVLRLFHQQSSRFPRVLAVDDPAESDESLAVLLAELCALDLLQQIRTDNGGFGG
jgi:hypothetical protein